MKKAVFLSVLFLAFGLVATPITQANYGDSYYETPYHNTQFHPKDPDYYNGNLRYTLKHRADIERASSPNLHYDKYQGDYYTCNWNYNTNLGTWVCNKGYPEPVAKAVQVCPVGTQLNAARTACITHQNLPVVAAQVEPTVVIQPAITYYAYEDQPVSRPYTLVQTGMGAGWIILMSGAIAYPILRRKK